MRIRNKQMYIIYQRTTIEDLFIYKKKRSIKKIYQNYNQSHYFIKCNLLRKTLGYLASLSTHNS